MMTPLAISRDARNPGNFFDIHHLEDRRQVLWILAAAKLDGEEPLNGTQIADFLADRHGIALSRQRVMAILEKERSAGTVKMTRRNGMSYFRVMRRGEDEVLVSTQSIFIDPNKALSGIRAVEDICRSLSGVIRICDTYVDSRTLDYIAQMEQADSVHLLTENVQDSRRLKRDLAAFGNEHALPLEVRVASPGHLHDRYILHADGLLVIGAGLKDLGKKQSMVVALPAGFAHELDRAFERLWNSSAKF
jgi:hypothetical protein